MDEENYPGESQETIPLPKASPLPWVLFGLTVLLAAVIAVVLMIRVDTAKSSAIAATEALEQARGRMAVLESNAKKLEGDVEALQSEKASLSNERDACSAKLQASSPSKSAAAAGKAPAAKKKTRKKHH